VPLSFNGGELDVLSRGLSLQFHEGNETFSCTVTPGVLLDLGSYHRLSFTEEDVLGVLLPELDRLASAKYRAGRFEQDGSILVREADLLRYGYHRVA
jgi:hypothetical protein